MSTEDFGTGTIRIYDVTNSLVIAETTWTSEVVHILDLGTLSNLPSGDAVWEVQCKTTAGEVRIYELNVQF